MAAYSVSRTMRNSSDQARRRQVFTRAGRTVGGEGFRRISLKERVGVLGRQIEMWRTVTSYRRGRGLQGHPVPRLKLDGAGHGIGKPWACEAQTWCTAKAPQADSHPAKPSRRETSPNIATQRSRGGSTSPVKSQSWARSSRGGANHGDAARQLLATGLVPTGAPGRRRPRAGGAITRRNALYERLLNRRSSSAPVSQSSRLAV